MEPNDSILSSYYPQHHHRSTTTQTATTASPTPITTTTSATNGGLFTNPTNHHHHQHQHQQHHNPTPTTTTGGTGSHYSSPEATPFVLSPPHSVTGRAPVPSAVPPQQETLKRKRGRPRKYGTPETVASGGGGGGGQTGGGSNSVKRVSSPLPSPPHKKEPSTSVFSSSSKKAQLAALGNSGQGFTPHIINLSAGEDVSQKIMSFVQQTKCAVCIISASGSISNASLRQPAMLGGNVSYEGRFEIVSLTGSFIHTDIGGGASSRSGGLSVCLSGTDGRLVGGGVGGPLLAAGPVQIIMGSFHIDTTRDADKRVEASSNKLPPHALGGSVSNVSYRPAPDSSGRLPVRGNDDHQSMGGNFMSRGMHVSSPRSNDWRGVLDTRSSGNIDFSDRMDRGGCQSPEEDEDDDHLGI